VPDQPDQRRAHGDDLTPAEREAVAAQCRAIDQILRARALATDPGTYWPDDNAARLVDAVHAGRDGQAETESRLELLAEQLLAALELEDDGKTTLAQYVAMLVEQRDQLRYERHLLGVARMTLDLVAAGDPTRWDHARAQAEDVAQRIVDEIGHPVTDEPALGPELRAENARLTAELADLRQRIADPRACPACVTQPHDEPAERHVHVTPYGYAIWAPDHDLPVVDTLRAEGYERGRRSLVEERAAKLAEDHKREPSTCSQVMIKVDEATPEQLRAEIARLDLKLRWMHDHYDDEATVGLMAAYKLADQRDQAGAEGEARGYRQAVDELRDTERYRNWWHAQHPRPDWFVGPGRTNHLADYLEAVGPGTARAEHHVERAADGTIERHVYERKYLNELVAGVREIVHRCPPDTTGIMPCCGKPVMEASKTDRITTEAERVTCSTRPDPEPAETVPDGGDGARVGHKLTEEDAADG
jgi:hypothetical protein